MKDGTLIDWLERNHTLHQQVEILYVVDGYEVTLTYDGTPIPGKTCRGKTLRGALRKAVLGER